MTWIKKFTTALLPVAGMLLFSTGCKKVDPTPLPIGGSTHTPNFICEHQPAAQRLNGQLVVFDLNHDANADKQYLVLSLIGDGNGFMDSCTVLQAPASIDQLATGWPATLKSAAFGTTRNIITDAKNAASFNIGNPWSFVPMLTGTNLYRKLNDPEYAAGMAGVKPGANLTMEVEYKPGPAYTPYSMLYRDITFYFADKMYTDNTPNGGLRSLDTLFEGASNIDWRNISQAVHVEVEDPATVTRYFSKFYFFDWTNWKYYVVDQIEGFNTYLSYPRVYFPKYHFKGAFSLNQFCKWPTGWGKK